jgi:hypothetical protein
MEADDDASSSSSHAREWLTSRAARCREVSDGKRDSRGTSENGAAEHDDTWRRRDDERREERENGKNFQLNPRLFSLYAASRHQRQERTAGCSSPSEKNL